MIKYRIPLILLLLLLCLVLSCKRKQVDSVEMKLESDAKHLAPLVDDVDLPKRIEQALQQWRNGQVDRKPLTLYALLGFEMDDESQFFPILTVCALDEDMDIIGFGIREHIIDEDGKSNSSLEEIYPVYADIHDSNDFLSPLIEIIVPAHIRDNNQKKNTEEWDNWVEQVSADVNDQMYLDASSWSESLPPIWISMPVPGKLEVLVYAIDRAGNKSQPISLIPPVSEKVRKAFGSESQNRALEEAIGNQ